MEERGVGKVEGGWRKREENNKRRREEQKEGKREERREALRGPGAPGVACSRGRRHCTQGRHWRFSATVWWWLSGSWCTGYLPVC